MFDSVFGCSVAMVISFTSGAGSDDMFSAAGSGEISAGVDVGISSDGVVGSDVDGSMSIESFMSV